MKRVAALIALFGAVYFMVGFSCGSSYPPPTEGGGFYVETQLNGAFASDVTFGGQWQSDAQGAQGSTFSIPNYTTTDLVGSYESLSGRAPAIWSFGEYSGPCDGLQQSGLVPLQQAAILECIAVSGEESELSTTNFAISPSAVFL